MIKVIGGPQGGSQVFFSSFGACVKITIIEPGGWLSELYVDRADLSRYVNMIAELMPAAKINKEGL